MVVEERKSGRIGRRIAVVSHSYLVSIVTKELWKVKRFLRWMKLVSRPACCLRAGL
jgi:hypothetical protein